ESFSRMKVQILDGDVMRNTPMAENIGFSKEDRAAHIRRMGQLAQMFADQGILVIASFVSPDAKVRADIKKAIGKDRFSEIYVKASKKERMDRDVKSMYKKAKEGKIENFTGFNAPYDVPKKPLVTCDTDKETIDESVAKVFRRVFEE